MTREEYKAECRKRYHTWTLRDALQNWDDFEERKEDFLVWCRHFKRDQFFEVGGKCHNPSGTLSSMVWVMQSALEPDQSRLFPCLDFEEGLQKCFIRRGLIIYLTGLLKDLETQPEYQGNFPFYEPTIPTTRPRRTHVNRG